MKRFLTALCALVMVMSLFSLTAFAAEKEYAIVTGSATLNLRAQPSASSQWLGRAYENDWVEILSNEDNGWHYCRVVSTGAYGYMAGNYLQGVNEGVSAGQSGVVKNPVSSQFLNLRQYPSYSAPVISIYYNGASFTVINYADGWYYVRMSDGNTGYFRREFVQVKGSAAEESYVVHTGNNGGLNLRNAPSVQGGIMASVKNGTAVTVTLKGDEYWAVRVGNQTGFMDPDFLKKAGSGSSSSSSSGTASVPQTQGYVIVNNPRATQFLNLRQQPSTTSKVLATYKNGIRLEIIEQGETWCKVYGKSSGNIGYVMTAYVKLYGVPSTPVKTVQNGNTYVNLRSAPSKVNGAVYEKLYSGNQVVVLTPGDEWTQVRYGSTVGYMMSCFLK